MDLLVFKREIPKIDKFPVTEIRSTINTLAEALEVISKKDEKGGYLRIFQVSNGDLIQIFSDVFGIFDSKNRLSFEKISQESASRLKSNPQHHSSLESHSEKKGFQGGAIITKNNFIISCAGMEKKENEALSLCLALHLNWLNEKESNRIAEKSGDEIFKKLKKTMGY